MQIGDEQVDLVVGKLAVGGRSEVRDLEQCVQAHGTWIARRFLQCTGARRQISGQRAAERAGAFFTIGVGHSPMYRGIPTET
jgi:hypothetical protein